VVVTVHWIGEFVSTPRAEWRIWAERLVAAGADAVVCHGPHVVGPVEWFEADGRRVPVVWSLGNLVSNMGWGVHPGAAAAPTHTSEFRAEARVEALAVLRVTPAAAGGPVSGLWIVPVWLEDNRPLVRPAAGLLREIFPRPMPWCRPVDAAAGCFEGAPAGWCEERLTMILDNREAVWRTLWGTAAPEVADCPAGASPYEPPAIWRAGFGADAAATEVGGWD
jgi:hypothetical protein